MKLSLKWILSQAGGRPGSGDMLLLKLIDHDRDSKIQRFYLVDSSCDIQPCSNGLTFIKPGLPSGWPGERSSRPPAPHWQWMETHTHTSNNPQCDHTSTSGWAVSGCNKNTPSDDLLWSSAGINIEIINYWSIICGHHVAPPTTADKVWSNCQGSLPSWVKGSGGQGSRGQGIASLLYLCMVKTSWQTVWQFNWGRGTPSHKCPR